MAPPTKTLHEFLFSPIRAARPAHVIHRTFGCRTQTVKNLEILNIQSTLRFTDQYQCYCMQTERETKNQSSQIGFVCETEMAAASWMTDSASGVSGCCSDTFSSVGANSEKRPLASSCSPASPHHSGFQWRYFREIWGWGLLRKICR